MSNILGEKERILWYHLKTSVRTSTGRITAGATIRKFFTRQKLEKVSGCGCLIVHREKLDFSLCVCGRKPETDVGQSEEHVDLQESTPPLNQVYLGCTQPECKTNKRIVG